MLQASVHGTIMNELKGSLTQIKNPPILRSSWNSNPIATERLPEYPHSKIYISYKSSSSS
jgi:hypothetical protein